MITALFLRLGWTRDDTKWVWLRVLAVAGMVATGVSSGALDLFGLSTWLGLAISPVTAHRLYALCVGVLWLGGKYDTSTLPGQRV